MNRAEYKAILARLARIEAEITKRGPVDHIRVVSDDFLNHFGIERTAYDIQGDMSPVFYDGQWWVNYSAYLARRIELGDE